MADEQGMRMSLAEAQEITKTPKLLRDLLGMAEVELSKAMVDMPQDKRPEQAGVVKGIRTVLSIIRQADKMVRDAANAASGDGEGLGEVQPVGLLQLLMRPRPVEETTETK